MTSPVSSFCCSARRGLTHAVGSHVIFVSGLGSSCSQPLFAKRPSQIVGSGRKMISRPPARGPSGRASEVRRCDRSTALCEPTPAPRSSARGPRLVTNPSCSACFQKPSKVGYGRPCRVGDRPAGDLAAVRPRPVVLHQVVARLAGLRVDERRQHLDDRATLVEWRNQRLHDRDGAVVGARVAPALERSALPAGSSGSTPTVSSAYSE